MKSLVKAMPLLVVAGLLNSSAVFAHDDAAAKSKQATAPKTHICHVKCTDPQATCDESQKVLELLEKLVSAYSAGDINTYEKYLDNQCVVIDEANHQVISGKANVLNRLRDHFTQHSPASDSPLVSFHIDQPYAKVSDKGDTCVVTFVATKRVGGSKPHTERANVTDIFVKRGNDWKKLHWQGKWETIADNQ